MNKEIFLRKNTKLLFILNVIYLLFIVMLKNTFLKLGYNAAVINVWFILCIAFLIISIFFNALLLFKEFNEKKSLVIIIILFIVISSLSVIIPITINKAYEKEFSKIGIKLSDYCKTYGCDTYETLYRKNNKEFIINKKYFDYDGRENDIKIVTTYDKEKVLSVNMTIYSDNEMFSSEIIKNALDGYINNFNYSISAEMVNKAFENRFSGKIKDDIATYEVKEIYKDNTLTKLKTIINFNFK